MLEFIIISVLLALVMVIMGGILCVLIISGRKERGQLLDRIMADSLGEYKSASDNMPKPHAKSKAAKMLESWRNAEG